MDLKKGQGVVIIMRGHPLHGAVAIFERRLTVGFALKLTENVPGGYNAGEVVHVGTGELCTDCKRGAWCERHAAPVDAGALAAALKRGGRPW